MYVMHNNKPDHCYYATKLQKDDKFDPSGKKLFLNMFSVLALVILGYHFFLFLDFLRLHHTKHSLSSLGYVLVCHEQCPRYNQKNMICLSIIDTLFPFINVANKMHMDGWGHPLQPPAH
jgi:hypothetical protein